MDGGPAQLLSQVLVQLPVFDLIQRVPRFVRQLFEPIPDQETARDVIAPDARCAALATLQAGHLFGLPMHFRTPPAHGTHFSCLVRGGRLVVGHNVVRAAVGRHKPE